TGVFDSSVRYCLNRRAIVGREVHAHVRPVFVQNGMIAVESETGGDVVEFDRKSQCLWLAQFLAVRIKKTRLAMCIAEGQCAHSTIFLLGLGGFKTGNQWLAAVAGPFFLINQLNYRARRQLIQRLMLAKCALERINDRFGKVVKLRRRTEAAVNLKGDANSPDVVFYKFARGADYPGAQRMLADFDIGIQAVA